MSTIKSKNSRLSLGLIAFCAASLLAALSAPVPALASTSSAAIGESERSAGLWYVDAMGVPLAKKEGLTGKGIRIAVVDLGINLGASELQGADIRVHGGYCLDQDTGKEVPADTTNPEIAQHGTSVVATLVGNGRASDGGLGAVGIIPDAQIDFYATGPIASEEQRSEGKSQACPTTRESDGTFSGDSWESAIRDAVNSGASIVSISLSGSVVSMRDALAAAARNGVVVVGAADNPGKDSIGSGGFPASGNGTVSVNAVGSDANVIGTSAGFERLIPTSSPNMGVSAPGVRLLSVGPAWGAAIEHGTSYATPLIAGALGLVKQKYPDATMNQAVQAMIHTTDQDKRNGQLKWDDQYGYGIVSVPDMLKSDPTSYPDVNPLFVSEPGDPRCKASDTSTQPSSMEDCAWARVPTSQDVSAASPPPSGSETPSTGGKDNTNGADVVVLIALIAAVFIVGVAAVLLFVFMSKRRKTRQ